VFFIVHQVFLKDFFEALLSDSVRSKLSRQLLLNDISELIIDTIRDNDISKY
jgi:hypothetical protein